MDAERSDLDSEIDVADTRSVVGPLLLLAALSSVAAGCIQFAIGQSYSEFPTLRAIFGVEGSVQVLAGVGLLVYRSKRSALFAVVVHCLVIARWSLTSIVGIGFVEGLESAQAPLLSDWIATLLASVAGFCAVLTLRPGGERYLRSHARSYSAAIATTAFLIVITVLAISTLEDDEPTVGVVAGPGDQPVTTTTQVPTTTAAPATTQPPVTSPATTDAPAPPTTTDPAADEPWRLGATDQDVADIRQLVTETQAALEAIGSVQDALDQGYVLFTDRHLVKSEYLNDDEALQSGAIEALLLGEVRGQERIVGATYLLDRDTLASGLPALGGPLLSWHVHGGGCVGRTGDGVLITPMPETTTCPRGSRFVTAPPMVHIWLEPLLDTHGSPRTEAACGTFVYIEAPVDTDVSGCGAAPIEGLGHER